MDNLTEEQIKEEIRKCKNDPAYFINKYCYIELEGKTVPFKLFEYQKNFIKFVMSNKYVVVNKSRQLGMSQVTGAFMLWYCIFQKNKECVVVSLSDNEAKYFLNRRVVDVFEKLPQWLCGNPVSLNEHKLQLDTNSQIEAIATTKKSLRGRSPSLVLIDEVAFMQWGEELISSALPSLQLGEHLILISTPNGAAGGIGQYFYNTWTKSKANESEFKPFEIHWYECPLYNKNAPEYADWETNEWAMKQYKSYTSDALFRQEILGEWIIAAETVIPSRVLESLVVRQFIRSDFIHDVDFTPDDAEQFSDTGWDEKFTYAKGLWIWKEPKPDHYYVLGCDISTGRGDDYSAVQVIDINDMEQVAEYRHKIPTSFFFNVIYNLAKYYNDGFIAIETNSDESVINKLMEVGYDNIYYRIKGQNTIVPGWNTNLKTRGLLISHLQDIMINRKVKVNSFRLINELKTFVWENGKAQAAKKANDDLVFAFMIATYVIEGYVSQQSIGINIKDDKQEEIFKNIVVPMITSETIDVNKETEIVDGNKIDSASRITPTIEDDFEINNRHYNFVGVIKKTDDEKS